ncbi:ArsR/SmtB family transcription factor [Pediococcus cellicola]|uniref:Transcriptional regulator, ArsR family protein n=1 Tax=Pediococcus cellicola TaxID=319652 RepID=A0A0R2IPK1_9LACO|nr:winged helix-turn-helix domain-containing protein [Pediococcus cellicola]KRN67041.1 transcriptional regulator, ArsR family protein [Pediococcus cellicola]GEL15024.1 transcriptional regulator [Pediococcus cellicola]
MNKLPDVSLIAEVFSNKTRVAVLDALMDGCAHTVNELSTLAKITPQTVDYHLQKLLLLNWIKLEKYGRFHYYSLISKDVASVLENLSPLAPSKKISTFNDNKSYKRIYYGRTCYDHLAGKLGVGLTQTFLNNNVIIEKNNDFLVTTSGSNYLQKNFNLNLAQLSQKKRAFCKPCLDWSERKDHIAGAVGNAIFISLLKREFVIKSENSRAVELTRKGEIFLNDTIGLNLHLEYS